MPTSSRSISRSEATTAAPGVRATPPATPPATRPEGIGDMAGAVSNVAVSTGARAASAIDDPGQLIRMGVMLSKVNAELKEVVIDEPTVDRLYDLHRALLGALTTNLGVDLTAELGELMPALDADHRTAAEVRLAHLQLSGWLEGLFQGIQMNVAGQQLQAQLAMLERQSAAAEPDPQGSAKGGYL